LARQCDGDVEVNVSEVFVTLTVMIGVIAVTVLLFGGWIIFNVLRIVGRGFGMLAGMGIPARQVGPAAARCPRPGCHAQNPAIARFCRRCGADLPSPHRVAVHRAAM
jgi:hypothetical protein